MAVTPLPADFTLVFDRGVRRPRPGVLIGGAPLRVFKLTGAGAARVEGWEAGEPVGPSESGRALAARLVEAGLAHPRPPAATTNVSALIVVPVRDDPRGLGATLESLAATAPGLAVVVADDGSEPPVRLRPGLAGRVVRRPVAGGPAAARNAGFEAGGTADVVVFVDAGCVLDPGWAATLLGHFADPCLGAAAPRVAARTDGSPPAALAGYESVHSPLDMGPAEAPVRPGSAVPYVPTAVLAVRREAFAQAGGFDQALRYGEDVDLVWRLIGRGWRVRYDPSVVATHPVRATRRRWLGQRFSYGRSAAPLAARHGRAAAPLAVSPWSAAAWGFLAVGRPAPALAIGAGTAAALARRAGGDTATARELVRLALTGHAQAGAPLAAAVRRAWLPPAVTAGAAVWKFGDRRAHVGLALAGVLSLTAGGLADWRANPSPGSVPGLDRAPRMGLLRWVGWRLADDLAYQAGVWVGVAEARSAAALLPRW